LIGAALGKTLGFESEDVKRPRVLEEAEAETEPGDENREETMSPSGTACLSLSSALRRNPNGEPMRCAVRATA